VYDGLVVDLDN